MIYDSLEQLTLYKSILPFSVEIINFLKTTDIFSLENGKHQIAGDSAYIIIEEYQTKSELEKNWESHKKYIDIQMALSGEEYIGYSPTRLLKIKVPYNSENDIIFYEDDSQVRSKLFIKEKYFCAFFPEDAHKPGFHMSKGQNVRKAVIKISTGFVK